MGNLGTSWHSVFLKAPFSPCNEDDDTLRSWEYLFLTTFNPIVLA